MRKVLVWVAVSVSVVALGACSSGGSSSAGGSTGDFCTALKGYAALFGASGTNSASSQQFDSALTDLTNKAPTEIKADMAAIAAAVKAEESLGSVASSDPTKAASLESQFSNQASTLESASTNVTKYAKDKCGIDLNSSNSSST